MIVLMSNDEKCSCRNTPVNNEGGTRGGAFTHQRPEFEGVESLLALPRGAPLSHRMGEGVIARVSARQISSTFSNLVRLRVPLVVTRAMSSRRTPPPSSQ